MRKARCVYCGSSRFEWRKVGAELYDDKGKVIRTTEVEAEVCLQCGEVYYPPEALKRLEEEEAKRLQPTP